MAQEIKDTTSAVSVIDPSYSEGDYFADPQRHSEDARFKADNFLKLFLRFAKQTSLSINSFVDVGCGSGDVIRMIADSLKSNGFDSASFKGYDVSPHVLNIKNEGIEYVMGDFCASDEFVDVVTLFDVFEHVPDMVEFIKSVGQRCKVIGFHIPLDYSFNFALRDKFRASLHNPGHLVFLDIASALNLLAISGVRVVDYQYTFGFLAPSGRRTMLAKMVFPLRYIVAQISPWLLSRMLGGASLVVIAITPHGLREMNK
ncbi:MAG: methyltransferase domain-containing protein [Anaerolineales bacterium]|jgi:SAM-dependent methyltransferase|nr:methyltransferase domain-containing protein [Anaerolineales bacterium]MCC6985892.1 methyltransferase domain-containing protein [Anaerolineales bacterium]